MTIREKALKYGYENRAEGVHVRPVVEAYEAGVREGIEMSAKYLEELNDPESAEFVRALAGGEK